jgi:hypothetical protein
MFYFILILLFTAVAQAKPIAPSDLSFSNITKNSVTLNWLDNSDNEKGFKIFRDGVLITIVDANTTTYTDSGLDENTTYTYKIKATDDEKLIYGNIKAYIPDIDLNGDNAYPDINGSVSVDVNSTQSLKTAIENAKPYTTINLADGKYENVFITFTARLHHVTIKAVNKHKAEIIPMGWDDDSAFVLPFCYEKSECVHHINFVGLDIHGEGNSSNPYPAKIVDKK